MLKSPPTAAAQMTKSGSLGALGYGAMGGRGRGTKKSRTTSSHISEKPRGGGFGGGNHIRSIKEE